MPYNILEIANVHGGDFNYIDQLIDEYSAVKAEGIKFQPFKYDQIALADFAWYSVYQKLFFDTNQWQKLISKAAKTKHVWIDVFDHYTLEITEQNLDKVYGLKFQASILFNKKLIKDFGKLNLTNKKIMLNISGIPIPEIVKYIQQFEQILKPAELILQIGFQSYPTLLEDSGLTKIAILKETFPYRIAFADHIAADNEDSISLPVIATLQGADIIEKHIKLSGTQPEYDHYSSIDKEKYNQYLGMLSRYMSLAAQPFINANEEKYLTNSIQIPVLENTRKAGQLISIDNDLLFKRTNKTGLRTNELEQFINSYHILASEKAKNDTLVTEDFKKANIATIIACRLKSSRLPKKAILKIGELSSVELCIKNALKFKNINHTILATSNLPEDAELANYTYSPQVIFHKGDPEDVMRRYLDIIDQLQIDVIVRVTADMQYVSDDILQLLLQSHFASGADYTRAKSAAIGTNLEIINAQALRYAKSFFPNANYSEYMTWYFINNPKHFRINEVELPESLVRDYRLTLDYQEDLDLFQKIEAHFQELKQEYTITTLFDYLDKHPEIAIINSGLEVKYKTDKILIDTLNKATKINN